MNLARPAIRLPALAPVSFLTSRTTRSLSAALGLVAALATTGCENKVDETPNFLPIAAGDAAVEVLESDATSGATCDCLVKDMWFRFDTLQIKSLDKTADYAGDHPVIGTLNPLWQKDIDRSELNFFLRVKEVSDTEITWDVANGARVQNTGVGGVPAQVCLVVETKTVIVTPRSGCSVQKSKPAKMSVYAGTPAIPKNCNSGWDVKNVIPLSDTYIQGSMTPDCSSIFDGLVVQAAIPKKALDNTCTCLTLGGTGLAEECGAMDPTYTGNPDDNNACAGCNPTFQSLTSLLNAFGDPLRYGCKLDDGDVGVCLEATFSAKQITTPPEACK